MTPTLSRAEARRIANLCDHRWDACYTRIKLRSDPVYAAVYDEVAGSDLPILDIGCGIGLLGQYLRHRGHRAPLEGFDYDQRKIASARKVAQRSGQPELSFSSGDARTGLPAFQGHVVILDILQFFTHEEQNLLLGLAAQRVAPGGKLIIRSTLRDDSWRFRVSLWGDHLAAVTRWMKAAPAVYPEAQQFRAVLEAAGLSVSIRPLWGNTPFNNHLIVAAKTTAAA
jgi:2-polyprenyl-3-methyl-5-hydroxy-6-metoxy-1,4-benzoquinol methylase